MFCLTFLPLRALGLSLLLVSSRLLSILLALAERLFKALKLLAGQVLQLLGFHLLLKLFQLLRSLLKSILSILLIAVFKILGGFF